MKHVNVKPINLRLFAAPQSWPKQALIAWSDQFDEQGVLAAYRAGIFPMPLGGMSGNEQMGWWSPPERGILELHNFRVTRSLRKSGRRYTTTIDAAFPQVLERCGDPSRPGGWIDRRIRHVYTALFAQGIVHSVETWDGQGRLVGGLYGVVQGAVFAGESMFHDDDFGRDASKVALGRLVAELRHWPSDHTLLDVQWVTDHLATMGATRIDRSEYLGRLKRALAADEMTLSTARRPGDWQLN